MTQEYARSEQPSATYPTNSEWNSYQPPRYAPYYAAYPPFQRKPHPVIQLLFWFWYLAVILPVSFSLTLALWICAIILPFTLPINLFQRANFPSRWVGHNWLLTQNDAIFYSVSTLGSIIGVAILIFAVLSFRPWLRLHKIMLRDLGGLSLK